ncbi:MAG TPA: hypothetical protein VJH23_03230 [archaeon]|nr:hypothetical protein [archaeon]
MTGKPSGKSNAGKQSLGKALLGLAARKRHEPADTRRIFKNVGGIYDHVIDATLQREGVLHAQKEKTNLSELHDSSIFLFKYILDRKDPRWSLASAHAGMKKKRVFEPINMENALLAAYASHYKGERGKFSVFNSLEHITQLARALKNIEIGFARVMPLREKMRLKNGYEIQFERTRSIQRGKDKRGVTGCPEALWQLQLYHDGGYLGRIGFNFHVEENRPVVTVANVQGVGKEFGKHNEVLGIKREFGTDLGGLLCGKLKEIMGQEFEYRGVMNREQNVVQYAMAFRRGKIPVFKAKGR